MSDIDTRPSIGIIFHPTFPPETLTEYARRAEAAGFDELWLWDDCFLPGAFTSAAIALSVTQRLRVGIGLLPARAYNPLFAAMEITTLARAFPGRFMPAFGHGVDFWMTQIGAASKSSLKTVQETVAAVRQLLSGECVTTHTEQLHLDKVQMQLTPTEIPPLYVGAMREKSLRMAGRVGDGTILTGMSSPAYIRWAREHIQAGMAEGGRVRNRVVVYLDVKVSSDGSTARAAVRRALAERLPWADVQVNTAGIASEVNAFLQKYDSEGVVLHMPDAWLDAFSAAGTPEQALTGVRQRFEAGADSVIFQPLNGDPGCLDEYIRYLMPELNRVFPRAQ